MFIKNGMNGDGEHFISRALPIDQFTYITMQQIRTKEGFRFSVSFNDKEEYGVINRQPRVYKDITIFMSDPSLRAARAIIETFDIVSPLHEPGNT